MRINFTSKKDLIDLILNKLNSETVTGETVNTFTFENKKFKLDLNMAQQLQDLINNESEVLNVLNKTYRVKKLMKQISNMLPDALKLQPKNEDSIQSPVTKTIFKTIRNQDHDIIASIINDNLSYVILSQINRNYKEDQDISLIKYLDLSLTIGTSILFFWFETMFGNYPKKEDDNYTFDNYCKKNNIVFHNTDLQTWVKSRITFIRKKQNKATNDSPVDLSKNTKSTCYKNRIPFCRIFNTI